MAGPLALDRSRRGRPLLTGAQRQRGRGGGQRRRGYRSVAIRGPPKASLRHRHCSARSSERTWNPKATNVSAAVGSHRSMG